MSPDITPVDVAIRLLAGLCAGALLGFDRGEHGRPAGLRTVTLVCLAATAGMVLANLLLSSAGKRPDGFAVMDVMRLPLGILTGVGFIGGGAILHRGEFVLGVTTAATLWFATVMGLCIGAGELALGAALLVIGLLVLAGFKLVERASTQTRLARLTVKAEAALAQEDLVEALRAGSATIVRLGVVAARGAQTFHCYLEWHAGPRDVFIPAFVSRIGALPGVSEIAWRPEK